MDGDGIRYEPSLVERSSPTYDLPQSGIHKEIAMKPVTIVNRLSIKSGKMDEFIDAQQKFASTLPSCGLLGARMYRSIDGQSAVLVSTFQSKDAQEQFMQRADFKEHVRSLQPHVESSNPVLCEEAYATGAFK
jgi:quinol monooxygenase YgiN